VGEWLAGLDEVSEGLDTPRLSLSTVANAAQEAPQPPQREFTDTVLQAAGLFVRHLGIEKQDVLEERTQFFMALMHVLRDGLPIRGQQYVLVALVRHESAFLERLDGSGRAGWRHSDRSGNVADADHPLGAGEPEYGLQVVLHALGQFHGTLHPRVQATVAECRSALRCTAVAVIGLSMAFKPGDIPYLILVVKRNVRYS
jgi:hypothetical protein